MPSAYRIFSVLFWLAHGGRQRVVARAVDVAESTFSKHCEPVIDALLAGLPKPDWPGPVERQQIARDFAQLTGRNSVEWKGLYVRVPVSFYSAERWPDEDCECRPTGQWVSVRTKTTTMH